jgi:hypothetical protein
LVFEGVFFDSLLPELALGNLDGDTVELSVHDDDGLVKSEHEKKSCDSSISPEKSSKDVSPNKNMSDFDLKSLRNNLLSVKILCV